MLNCWEFNQCGNYGKCPTSTFTKGDGYLGGKNAGMACMFIPHTMCNTKTRGDYAEKVQHCPSCTFYKFLESEKGYEISKEKFLNYVLSKKNKRILKDKVKCDIQKLGIPSKNEVVTLIKDELKAENPDVIEILNLIRQDVAIAMQIYKVGDMKQILGQACSSLLEALELVGLVELNDLIIPSLIDIPADEQDVYCKYIEHSILVGKVSEYVARAVGDISEEYAYMAGIFHDCAVPYLLRRFDNYRIIIDLPLTNIHSCVDREDILFNTNHCIAGYLICKSMTLPNIVCDVIKNHHNKDIALHEDNESRKLAACLYISENIVFSKFSSLYPMCITESGHTINEDMDDILYELNLSIEDVNDLCEDALSTI